MKLTVNRNELATAVKSAASIIERGDRSVFSGPKICLSAKRGSLSVSINRYVEQYKEIISAEIEVPGAVFLNTDTLNRVLSGTISEFIELTRDDEHGMLAIKTEHSETTIPFRVGDSDLIPKFKKLPHRFKLKKKDFRDIYDHCFFVIGENEGRRNLMGLNIKRAGSEIVFTGGDAFRIVEYRFKSRNTVTDGVILPKTSLKKINGLFGRSKELNFRFDSENFIVTDGDRTFQTVLIQADYPNLDNLINSSNKPEAKKIRLDFKTMLRAARLLKLSEDSDLNAVCKFTLSNQNIRVENQNFSEQAVSRVDVPCDYTGEGMKIGMNINFLNQALLKLKKKGEFEIIALGPLGPVFYLDPENPRFKSIQMPVKIKW